MSAPLCNSQIDWGNEDSRVTQEGREGSQLPVCPSQFPTAHCRLTVQYALTLSGCSHTFVGVTHTARARAAHGRDQHRVPWLSWARSREWRPCPSVPGSSHLASAPWGGGVSTSVLFAPPVCPVCGVRDEIRERRLPASSFFFVW